MEKYTMESFSHCIEFTTNTLPGQIAVLTGGRRSADIQIASPVASNGQLAYNWRAKVEEGGYSMRGRGLAVAVVLAVVLLAWASPALAGAAPPPPSDTELARRYAPVLYFHPAEIFRPQSVDVIVERADLL
jgi:hypothetical protein